MALDIAFIAALILLNAAFAGSELALVSLREGQLQRFEHSGDRPEGEYSTVAGLVLQQLGHLPEPGERVEVNGWQLEVVAIEGHAISRVRLRRVGGG